MYLSFIAGDVAALLQAFYAKRSTSAHLHAPKNEIIKSARRTKIKDAFFEHFPRNAEFLKKKADTFKGVIRTEEYTKLEFRIRIFYYLELFYKI